MLTIVPFCSLLVSTTQEYLPLYARSIGLVLPLYTRSIGLVLPLHARSIGLALYWPIRLVSTLSSTHFEWRRVSADMKLVPDLAWIKPRHPCFFSDRLYTLQNNNLSPHKALSCLLPRLCLWNLEFNLSMYTLSLRWQEPVVTFKTLMEMFPHPPTIQWSQGSSQQVINANKQ